MLAMISGRTIAVVALLLAAAGGAADVRSSTPAPPADGSRAAAAIAVAPAATGAGSEAVDGPLATAHRSLADGNVTAAIRQYEAALRAAESAKDPLRQAIAANGLGAALLAAGRVDEARPVIERAATLAATAGSDAVAARAQLTLGNLYALHGPNAMARDAFGKALLLARRADDPPTVAKALLNAARWSRAQRRGTDAATMLEEAIAVAYRLPDSDDKAAILISAGQLTAAPGAAPGSAPAPAAEQGIALLRAAHRVARASGNPRLASTALGETGAIRERQGAFAEALPVTLAAAFAAQSAGATDLAFRWDWQAGRILRHLSRDDAALDAYRRAVSALQATRDDLACEYRARGVAFREAAGPLFYEAADVVLERARARRDTPEAQGLLREARDLTELAKVDELQDYFRDDCVTALGVRITSLDELTPRTAVVYPIILRDRVELLVAIAGRLHQISVATTAEALEEDVRALRRALQRYRGSEYLPIAQRLYGHLVAPLEPLLAQSGVDVLVFVPERFLRTIPMAALHDGSRFLVERYAIVTTPGLTLTDPRPLDATRSRALAGGVSESVQGFPALPAVAAELSQMQALYGATVLKNEDFTAARLGEELRANPYRVLHIATHGKIEADVRRSFLLTHDGRLTMDDLDRLIGLRKYSRAPVEMLTLSACETALGDDRAALGLAGIAVKAGARSAVATLWSISDEATAVLMPEFFRQLQTSTVSRAQALQRAQQKTLADPRFRHPGFWAPFLLIGGWL